MSKQPTIGNVGRGAIWSMASSVAGQALSLIVFLVTARYVSKEAFGIMAVSLLTVEAFRQIVINSFGVTLTANRNATGKDYNACFLAILVSGIVCAGILFFLAEPVADMLDRHEVATTLKLISVILLTAGLSHTHEVWLAKHIQFKTLALRSIFSIAIGGGVGIYMAIHGYGLTALIVQQIVTGVVTVVFLWSASAWKPGLSTGKENIAALLHYTKFVLPSRATSFFGTQSDVYFASYHFGAAVTGSYNAAKRILLAFSSTLSSGLNAVALPAFAAYGQDEQGLGRGFLKAASLTSLLTAPLYFGLIVVSDDAIHVLLGTKWLDAAPLLSALILTAYMTSIVQYNHNVCLVRGKPHWDMWLNIFYTASNIALFAWSVQYGVLMLAVASSIRAVAFLPFSLFPALGLLNMNLGAYVKEMAPSVLAALGMAATVYGLKIQLAELHVLARLLILVPVGAVVYTALIFLLNRKLFGELVNIVSHIRHK